MCQQYKKRKFSKFSLGWFLTKYLPISPLQKKLTKGLPLNGASPHQPN
jgi:hypothetical protein